MDHNVSGRGRSRDQFWPFFGHKMAKYQYFSMGPSVYDYYMLTTSHIQISAQKLLKCPFYVQKTSKIALNRHYLSSRLSQSGGHEKTFRTFIFRFFALKFLECVGNLISMLFYF